MSDLTREILWAGRKNVVIYVSGGLIGDATINCGFVGNSSRPDHGREWVGENWEQNSYQANEQTLLFMATQLNLSPSEFKHLDD
ncbi:OLC1v1007598C1 [Oldenlandia corymbosa var. corymbosa]|uniref:OLC1v1007598C1 n=1 Tax=Oldenlandia corymbosa var. corymbosa TaxID=529605 RepID=A0AAV1DJP8_OLDCO|nr:OLC1v1007598C1 [Oldenlandia corymbosa var. corymbosa]